MQTGRKYGHDLDHNAAVALEVGDPEVREVAWQRERTGRVVDEILVREDDRRTAVAAAGERQGVHGRPEGLPLFPCLCVTVVVHYMVLVRVQAAHQCLADGSFPQAGGGDENHDEGGVVSCTGGDARHGLGPTVHCRGGCACGRCREPVACMARKTLRAQNWIVRHHSITSRLECR